MIRGRGKTPLCIEFVYDAFRHVGTVRLSKISHELPKMSLLNHAAVEALCSATYLENYLETMENLPDDLQRVVSQLRELDIKCRGKQ